MKRQTIGVPPYTGERFPSAMYAQIVRGARGAAGVTLAEYLSQLDLEDQAVTLDALRSRAHR